MADVNQYEHQYQGRDTKQKDSGDRTDHKTGFGRSNFRGEISRKSGQYVAPRATGQPWNQSRQDQQEKSYASDYTRKASTSSHAKSDGPKQPSPKVAKPLYAGNKDRSGN